ncbi:HlyU family transcriptional regulator [Vibrio vulnificus]|uniref:HlyU family transcriptional regulator n=1 Tax=Vibrio vulnificus TaxID=672 RepID=UPI003242CBA6
MGLFSRLFGSSKDSEAKKEIEHNGFLIYAESLQEGGQYRVAGRITKEVEGELKSHRFIRSDVLTSEADANELMVKKAQMFIDQMRGEIFS